jgi:hypothetical protein
MSGLCLAPGSAYVVEKEHQKGNLDLPVTPPLQYRGGGRGPLGEQSRTAESEDALAVRVALFGVRGSADTTSPGVTDGIRLGSGFTIPRRQECLYYCH